MFAIGRYTPPTAPTPPTPLAQPARPRQTPTQTRRWWPRPPDIRPRCPPAGSTCQSGRLAWPPRTRDQTRTRRWARRATCCQTAAARYQWRDLWRSTPGSPPAPSMDTTPGCPC